MNVFPEVGGPAIQTRLIFFSHAVLGMFGGEMDFINSQLDDVHFIKVYADVDIMVERWLERNTRIIEAAGSTMAKAW